MPHANSNTRTHLEDSSVHSDSPIANTYTVKTNFIVMKAPLPCTQQAPLRLLLIPCHLVLQVYTWCFHNSVFTATLRAINQRTYCYHVGTNSMAHIPSSVHDISGGQTNSKSFIETRNSLPRLKEPATGPSLRQINLVHIVTLSFLKDLPYISLRLRAVSLKKAEIK
jgi:hypothetical protein